MLSLCILLFGVSVYIVNYHVCKTSVCRNLINLHSLWWLFLLFISSLNLFGLYPLRLETYGLYILYVVGFNLGFVMVDRWLQPNCEIFFTIKHTYNSLEFYQKSKIVGIVLIALILISGYILSKFIDIILASSFAEAHGASMNTDLYGTPLLMILYKNLIVPLGNLSVVVIVCCCFAGRYSLNFVLCVIFVLLVLLIALGKATILMILGTLVLIYIISASTNINILFGWHFSIKTVRRNVILMGLFLIFITLVFSVLRSNNSFSLQDVVNSLFPFFEEVYSYLVGPFRAFEFGISDQGFLSTLGYPNYGINTTMGFQKLLDWICMPFGFSYNSGYEHTGEVLQEMRLTIGTQSSGHFNFAMSSLYYFYLDFGPLGILLYSLIVGIILRFAIRLLHMRATIPSLALLVYFLYCTLTGFFSWSLANPSGASYIIYLLSLQYLFTRRVPGYFSKFILPRLKYENN